MNGYDPDFLALRVPLPALSVEHDTHVLDYTHFTVVLNARRRLAAATAVNIDGATSRDVPRGDNWRLDPRAPESAQVGNELYARNDLDRGHLVRRRDPVWGEPEEARQANDDTFFYTNAAPQAAGFNQSKETWNGIEDHVLNYALQWQHRVSVFTGPVFADDDPEYRGIQIPLQFFKIAAWMSGDTLRSAAFLLDQSPALDDIDLSLVPDVPPLGPFKLFQVSVSTIAELTALDLGVLETADAAGDEPSILPRDARKRIEKTEEIYLGK